MAKPVHIHAEESFIKTPRQLAIVVVAAFAIPVILIVGLAQYFTGGLHIKSADPAFTDEATAKRIKPVGDLVFGEAPPPVPATAPPASAAKVSAAAGPADGKGVFEKVCTVCHGAGIAGAPKAGDKVAWVSRVAQGKPALYDHAIKGIRLMPAKGGNTALADAEVKAAVDYMIGLAK